MRRQMTTGRAFVLLAIIVLFVAVAVGSVCRLVVDPAVSPTPTPTIPVVVLPTLPQPSATPSPTSYAPFDFLPASPMPSATPTVVPTVTPTPEPSPTRVPASPVQRGELWTT